MPRGRKPGAAVGPKDVPEGFPPLPCESLDVTGCWEKRQPDARYGGGKQPYTYITEKGVEVIRQMRGEGLAIPSIAFRIGLPKSTLKDCINRQPELKEAVEIGRAREEDHLIQTLYRAAWGGFAPAAMFLLKTRHGYRENDSVAPPTSNVIVHLPSAMSMDDLKRMKDAGVNLLQLPTSIPEDEPELVEAEGEEAP